MLLLHEQRKSSHKFYFLIWFLLTFIGHFYVMSDMRTTIKDDNVIEKNDSSITNSNNYASSENSVSVESDDTTSPSSTFDEQNGLSKDLANSSTTISNVNPATNTIIGNHSYNVTDRKNVPIKICILYCSYVYPQPAEKVDTRFLIYNNINQSMWLNVSATNLSPLWPWARNNFNVNATTKVIIHGFHSSCSESWIPNMIISLMKVGNSNVICVDYEKGAVLPNYTDAIVNTRLVGQQLATLISGLQNHTKLSLDKVHLIGFSLGAHVAGIAGTKLKQINRITGLDPTSIGYSEEHMDNKYSLDPSDAKFVDVIHTDGELFGTIKPLGHVDFYPNGGEKQKGCLHSSVDMFSKAIKLFFGSKLQDINFRGCNHERAVEYFINSINPNYQFTAMSCDSYDHFVDGRCFFHQMSKNFSNMGYYADEYPTLGKMYLKIKDEKPFFVKNYYRVEVTNSLSNSVNKEALGNIVVQFIDNSLISEEITITRDNQKLIEGESFESIITPNITLSKSSEIRLTYFAKSSSFFPWDEPEKPTWKVDNITITSIHNEIFTVSMDGNETLLESSIKSEWLPLKQLHENNVLQPNKATVIFINLFNIIVVSLIIIVF